MIYRSNLTCPDLSSHFKHLVSRPMGHSFGHDVPSDWGDKAADDPVFGLYKNCGMWTHDEAAILYTVAKWMRGPWVDVGSHTGWTTAHIASGSDSCCLAVDPLYRNSEARGRALDNLNECDVEAGTQAQTSLEYFSWCDELEIVGFCIDGDHEPGQPLKDAQNAAKHLAETGVIIFHDGVGQPVQEAVLYLMSIGFKARAYYTPHLVFCCWRGDFVPPDHVPDENVKRQLLDGRFKDFPFEEMV